MNIDILALALAKAYAGQGVPGEYDEIIQILENDKADRALYVLASDEILQTDALEILSNIPLYTGKLIEFLTNGDNPTKTVCYGFVMTDKDNNSYLISLNRNGTFTQWNRDGFEKHLFETYNFINEPIVDMDNLTIDIQGNAPYLASVQKAINKPSGSGDFGIVIIIAYSVKKQIQLYMDIDTAYFWSRTVNGEPNRHSFGTWTALNGSSGSATVVITSENGRYVADHTSREIIDLNRNNIVKAEYTDPTSREIRTYYFSKQMPDGTAVFSKDGYIEDGIPKQTLIFVNYAGDVTVETKSYGGAK